MVVRHYEVSLALRDPEYAGLRMDADEYLALPEDGFKYELIDGVVVMSPGANFGHNNIAGLIEHWIRTFLDSNPIGQIVHETDVRFAGNLVYRPDLSYVSNARSAIITTLIEGPPDLIVEVVSRHNRPLDVQTKRADYERFGVREYWIVDPGLKSFTFLRLANARYVEIQPESDAIASEAIPGFRMNLAPIREQFNR